MDKHHIVLLGDSIFDNAVYVPGEPPVIDQFRLILKEQSEATLLAVDGSITSEVFEQTSQLPKESTHLFISSGGNDALNLISVLEEPASSVVEVLQVLAQIRSQFQQSYHQMLEHILGLKKYVAICTIYDSVPNLGPAEVSALSLLNDVILREAFFFRIPVVDLRLICNEPSDYSSCSPIEPSAKGGAKIAKTLFHLYQDHDFTRPRSVIYS